MAEESKKAAKPRRWPKILLVVSLGLNLLVIGVVVGVVSGHRAEDRRINLRDAAYGPYARALSPEDRREIGAAMRRDFPPDSGDIPRLRQNYLTLIKVLRGEFYDEAQVRKLIGAQQEIALRRQKLGQMLLLERLATMTFDERKRLARRLRWTLKRSDLGR